jgi:hypothetical protein
MRTPDPIAWRTKSSIANLQHSVRRTTKHWSYDPARRVRKERRLNKAQAKLERYLETQQ